MAEENTNKDKEAPKPERSEKNKEREAAVQSVRDSLLKLQGVVAAGGKEKEKDIERPALEELLKALLKVRGMREELEKAVKDGKEIDKDSNAMLSVMAAAEATFATPENQLPKNIVDLRRGIIDAVEATAKSKIELDHLADEMIVVGVTKPSEKGDILNFSEIIQQNVEKFAPEAAIGSFLKVLGFKNEEQIKGMAKVLQELIATLLKAGIAGMFERIPGFEGMAIDLRWEIALKQAKGNVEQQYLEGSALSETKKKWTAAYNAWLEQKRESFAQVPPRPFGKSPPTIAEALKEPAKTEVVKADDTKKDEPKKVEEQTEQPKGLFGVEGFKAGVEFPIQKQHMIDYKGKVGSAKLYVSPEEVRVISLLGDGKATIKPPTQIALLFPTGKDPKTEVGALEIHIKNGSNVIKIEKDDLRKLMMYISSSNKDAVKSFKTKEGKSVPFFEVVPPKK